MKYYTTVRRRHAAPAVSTVFEEMQIASSWRQVGEDEVGSPLMQFGI